MIPKWSALSKVGNSSAVRLTPLIPLVGYLILFNCALGPSLHLAEQFSSAGPDQQPPLISTKLLLVYFGLVSLAIGSVIYAFFCPDDIKAHPTASDYVAAEAPTVSQAELIVARLQATEFVGRATEVTNALAPRSPGQGYGRAEWDRDWQIWVKGLLRVYFDYQNSVYPWARFATATAFIIGFLTLGWPSLLVFIKVVQLLNVG